jgi:hypothetical protein
VETYLSDIHIAEQFVNIQGCECGNPLPDSLVETSKCEKCSKIYHDICIERREAQFICKSCLFYSKSPESFRKIKLHKLAVDLPLVRDNYGTFFPFVSMEEDGEGSFGRTELRMASQSNHSDHSLQKTFVSELKQENWESFYQDSKSPFHHHYLRSIKEGKFSNLIVFDCVWKCWHQLCDNFNKFILCQRNTEQGKWIEYSFSSKAIRFNWAKPEDGTHQMCFCVGNHHILIEDFIPIAQSQGIPSST